MQPSAGTSWGPFVPVRGAEAPDTTTHNTVSSRMSLQVGTLQKGGLHIATARLPAAVVT